MVRGHTFVALVLQSTEAEACWQCTAQNSSTCISNFVYKSSLTVALGDEPYDRGIIGRASRSVESARLYVCELLPPPPPNAWTPVRREAQA